jgi:hypothetical protein
MLQRALDKKEAVPFTRFNNDMGHKPGKGPGRYPQKASKYIIELLKSVKANALAKGLNTDNLIIKKLVANKASRPWRYGRQRRRKAKRTHIEIIVKEIEPKTKKENKKSDKKQQESNKKQEIPNKKSKKAESKSKKKEEGKESAKKTVKKDNKKAKEKKRLDKEEKKE